VDPVEVGLSEVDCVSQGARQKIRHLSRLSAVSGTGSLSRLIAKQDTCSGPERSRIQPHECALNADPAAVGEYVLIHVGFAMEKIDTERAKESIEIYEQIAKQMRAEEGSVYESMEPRAGAEN